MQYGNKVSGAFISCSPVLEPQAESFQTLSLDEEKRDPGGEWSQTGSASYRWPLCPRVSGLGARPTGFALTDPELSELVSDLICQNPRMQSSQVHQRRLCVGSTEQELVTRPEAMKTESYVLF